MTINVRSVTANRHCTLQHHALGREVSFQPKRKRPCESARQRRKNQVAPPTIACSHRNRHRQVINLDWIDPRRNLLDRETPARLNGRLTESPALPPAHN